MANIRTYTKDADDTLEGVTASNYETGTGANARLRKINLNVDIATQDELNQAFNFLSAAIDDISTGTLSNYYTKAAVDTISAALSDAASTDVGAEATARQEADEAITASLSAYALSTTVADAYAVTVESPYDIEGDKLRYTIKQGELTAGYLDVAKDQFVSAASFDGTVLTLTLRDGSKISTDLASIADYTALTSDTAEVTISPDHKVSVDVVDYISKTTVGELSAAAITAAKEYTDTVSGDLSAAFEPRVADNEGVAAVVKDLSATWGGGGTAIQSVAGDVTYISATTDENKNVSVFATPKLTAAVTNAEEALQAISAGTDGTYVTTTVTGKDANNKQTVGVAVTTADLTADTAGLAVNTDVKQYVDNAVSSKNVDAEGDDIVSASAADNKVTVTASNALCSVVARVEGSADDWDEVSAKIDTATVVNAANQLSGLALSALEDYQDIDAIILEVEKIKGALINFTTALEA